jgi:hypothetical protein
MSKVTLSPSGHRDLDPDKLGNWNWDIHIRYISEEDYYSGLMVQSYGNYKTIYEIDYFFDRWMFRATHSIIDREPHKLDSQIEKYPSGKPPDKNIGNGWHTIDDDGNFRWSETIYSRRCNLQLTREEKLNQLGI